MLWGREGWRETKNKTQKAQLLTSEIVPPANTDGFNLLTALVQFSSSCCLFGSTKVINGAITADRSGHRTFSSQIV